MGSSDTRFRLQGHQSLRESQKAWFSQCAGFKGSKVGYSVWKRRSSILAPHLKSRTSLTSEKEEEKLMEQHRRLCLILSGSTF